MNLKEITIQGAREHNLKNVNLKLPRNNFIVFTGVSGSGKTSLAFDTIYAEGQRRYVESLSAYARQFLGQVSKPDVDVLEGLSPSISIDQRAATRNPRSTVGTVTEIYDYMRLLYARVGKPHCPHCNKPISQQTVEQIVDHLLKLEEGTKMQILSPLVRSKKGEHVHILEDVRRKGYVRVRVNGEVRDLDEDITLDKNKWHTIEVVVDRIIIRDGVESRLADSLETALKLSEGLVIAQVIDGEETLFSEKFACPQCGFSFEEMSPRVFSFNSPYGACPDCSGLGMRMELDPDKVIPNPDLSIAEGAIHPWNWQSRYHSNFLRATARHYGIDLETPFKDLTSEEQDILLHGSTEPVSFRYVNAYGRTKSYKRYFPGILNVLAKRYREAAAEGSTAEELANYTSTRSCPSCEGQRLKDSSLAVTVGGKNIAEVSALSVHQAEKFFRELELSEREAKIAHQVMKEIKSRLSFLQNVGLEYLNLNRSAATLSGGEAQRIRLATQIGSGLTGVIYILDEPTIGLHQRDNQRLLRTLESLRDLDNTVMVVEHDEETIRAADYVVDMGPGAGAEGGEIVAAGTLDDILETPESITGEYLSGRSCISVPRQRRPLDGRWLTVRGARAHNLQDIDVHIPMGIFTCVTGVSGSGKSTLINEILARELSRRLHKAREKGAPHDKIEGLENLDKVVEIDQSPIGRTPRSNPATYTGLFDGIRELFAQTQEARMRGYKPGRFSFNVKGGRCESCRGDGILKIEMHFLPDVYVPCEVCAGRRYNRETLEVRFKGLNIAEVLDLTVEEALDLFSSFPRVKRRLQCLYDVGLGYIRLGQPATTLSGGEAQRVKLATELSRRSNGRTLYILDEPTTGLHIDDIRKLLQVLERLVDVGNTVVVIEHNMEVIKKADHLIDLGPEGGTEGGRIVAQGTPEEVTAIPESHTGRFLKPVLGIEEKDKSVAK